MRVVIGLALVWLTAGLARADWQCSAPLADWQPRETLVAQLEGQGWRDIAVRIEDGCYLVHAFSADGERLHGMFDPATLKPVEHGGHGRHGEGRRHGRFDD